MNLHKSRVVLLALLVAVLVISTMPWPAAMATPTISRGIVEIIQPSGEDGKIDRIPKKGTVARVDFVYRVLKPSAIRGTLVSQLWQKNSYETWFPASHISTEQSFCYEGQCDRMFETSFIGWSKIRMYDDPHPGQPDPEDLDPAFGDWSREFLIYETNVPEPTAPAIEIFTPNGGEFQITTQPDGRNYATVPYSFSLVGKPTNTLYAYELPQDGGQRRFITSLPEECPGGPCLMSYDAFVAGPIKLQICDSGSGLCLESKLPFVVKPKVGPQGTKIDLPNPGFEIPGGLGAANWLFYDGESLGYQRVPDELNSNNWVALVMANSTQHLTGPSQGYWLGQDTALASTITVTGKMRTKNLVSRVEGNTNAGAKINLEAYLMTGGVIYGNSIPTLGSSDPGKWVNIGVTIVCPSGVGTLYIVAGVEDSVEGGEAIFDDIKVEVFQPAQIGGVVLRLDDAFDFHEEATKQARNLGLEVDCAITTGWVNKPGRLTSDALRRMKDNKVGFLPHGVNHLDVSQLSKEQANFEMSQSQRDLEQMVCETGTVFILPWGGHNATVHEISQKIGYKCLGSAEEGTTPNGGWSYGSKVTVMDSASNFQQIDAALDRAEKRREVITFLIHTIGPASRTNDRYYISSELYSELLTKIHARVQAGRIKSLKFNQAVEQYMTQPPVVTTELLCQPGQGAR